MSASTVFFITFPSYSQHTVAYKDKFSEFKANYKASYQQLLPI